GGGGGRARRGGGRAGRRGLGPAVAAGARAATTVSATMAIAHAVGVRVFATGGIGGVHPSATGVSWDVYADLTELARTPVAVVCAGAKSVLDLAATLEVLEANGVPVLGYQPDTLPAFYLTTSGLPVAARVGSPEQAAAALRAHWALGGAGAVVARPVPQEVALSPEELRDALRQAELQAAAEGVRGPALTPFL